MKTTLSINTFIILLMQNPLKMAGPNMSRLERVHCTQLINDETISCTCDFLPTLTQLAKVRTTILRLNCTVLIKEF